mmetsp:Transcript_19129/g.19392  ORF Transcript_19129/g.19392 Transcript_19129/m.19392 type:complete len:98 (+) Transcript_19129:312-605(+)
MRGARILGGEMNPNHVLVASYTSYLFPQPPASIGPLLAKSKPFPREMFVSFPQNVQKRSVTPITYHGTTWYVFSKFHEKHLAVIFHHYPPTKTIKIV